MADSLGSATPQTCVYAVFMGLPPLMAIASIILSLQCLCGQRVRLRRLQSSTSSLDSTMPPLDDQDVDVLYMISESKRRKTFRARDQQGELFIKVFLGNFWERYRAEELAVNEMRAFPEGMAKFTPGYLCFGRMSLFPALSLKLDIKTMDAHVMVSHFVPDTLHNRLRWSISLVSAAQIALGLFRALEFLHRDIKMAHHDIKPENIGLVHGDGVKLFDFDMAVLAAKTTSQHGTICFLSPELVPGERDITGERLMCSDIYAAGLCIWTLLMRSDPLLRRGERGKVSATVPFPYEELTNPNLPRPAAELEMAHILRQGRKLPSKKWWDKHTLASFLVKVFKTCIAHKAHHRPTADRVVTAIQQKLKEYEDTFYM